MHCLKTGSGKLLMLVYNCGAKSLLINGDVVNAQTGEVLTLKNCIELPSNQIFSGVMQGDAFAPAISIGVVLD